MRNLLSALLLIASVACGDAPAKPTATETKSVAPLKTPPAGAQTTESGLASVVRKEGAGEQRPKPYDKVRVAFTAWNEKGKLVDSSDKHGGSVIFDLAGVIVGWRQALQAMRVGEQRRIWVPDDLGYPGRPGYPRGNAVFDIELLEIIAAAAPEPAPPDIAAPPADAVKTASGLAYKLLTRGQGADTPNAWDRVTIHYTGWTSDGVLIETSRTSDRPSIFDLANVMPGWREILQLLSAGDRARVWIPQALAYQGRTGKPAGTVVFDLELIAIDRRLEPPRAPVHVSAPPRDAKRTKSGLAYEITRKGAGTMSPMHDDHVEVHYSAWTADGELFDSSIVRGKPNKLPLRRLIAGWAEGLTLMREGDKALLWIPEQLAYQGKPGGPKGMLVYEVELLRITR